MVVTKINATTYEAVFSGQEIATLNWIDNLGSTSVTAVLQAEVEAWMGRQLQARKAVWANENFNP